MSFVFGSQFFSMKIVYVAFNCGGKNFEAILFPFVIKMFSFISLSRFFVEFMRRIKEAMVRKGRIRPLLRAWTI